MDKILDLLRLRGIKPTANRISILRDMLEAGCAYSQRELEDRLSSLDKSVISRTIHLFLSHKLIHPIVDGSGSIKYAVCEAQCNCEVYEQHTHFSCTVCGKTFCLEDISAPMVQLPEGFTFSSINYVIKGICADCHSKKRYD